MSNFNFFSNCRFFSINLRRFVEWWPAVRARGRRSFIVSTGIPRFGIPTALFALVVHAIVRVFGGRHTPLLEAGRLLLEFGAGALLAVFSGALGGAGLWAFNNRLYDSLVKSR